MKYFVSITIFLLALISNAASAGTKALGAEIGVSTVGQLKTALSKTTKIMERGTNKYTGGQMLATDGSPYDIEGLSEVTYIFDAQGRLAGIIMDMNKDRLDSIYRLLRQKYTVSYEERPFVGNQLVRFKTSDSIIEIVAPHMDFTMQVRYIRNDLVQKFNVDNAAETAAKKKSEAEKF